MNNKILVILPIFVILAITIPPSFGDEDEDDEDREGFGIMEREREHQDEGIPIGTDLGNLILYGTIAAIIGSVAYTAFKISSSRRKSSAKTS